MPFTDPRDRGARQTASEPQSGLFTATGIRETIESLAIAFVLAFLFRTFQAEAFVIPTGSMAPTLMGRHKDLTCPMCGAPYQLSASDEVDNDGARRPDGRGEYVTVQSGACPMCRYTANLFRDFAGGYPRSYNGDRILVDKLAYDFAEPRRWDVVVFHYPNDATTNYIKRLIGLPGETVRIQNGDIWTRQGKEAFHIARKQPEKLLAMLQPVFDNDYMPEIAAYGWPQRWVPEQAGTPNAWQSVDQSDFAITDQATDEQWLRYHHRVPTYNQWDMRTFKQWQAVRAKDIPLQPMSVQDRWVKDFTAFDTSRDRGQPPAPTIGGHWVGDLAVECTADIQSEAGTLAVELRKGGRHFQCRFDLATGRATLSSSGSDMAGFHPTAATAVRGKGQHSIRFSNCDDQLLVWVDGRVVQFDKPTTYQDLNNIEPGPDDLTPVGVGSRKAKVRISHLRILRDIYYISIEGDAPHGRVGPEQFSVDFPLEADQFFMLGDNSANSQDGRLWGGDYWVDRDLLIGRAMFIYWPHSWYYAPVVDVPLWPNFSRMGLVR